MRIGKMIGALVFACLMVAVAASGASAALFVQTKGTNGAFNGEVNSTEQSILTNTVSGAEVTCPSLSVKGRWNSRTDALVLFLWHKCTAFVNGVSANCTTSGEPTGLIHSFALALPVIIKLKSGLISPGLLIQAHPGKTFLSEFICGGLVTVQVQGTVVVTVTAPSMIGVKSHEWTGAAETEGVGMTSKQKYTATEENPTANFHLEMRENGGAFVNATEKTPPILTAFEEGGAEGEFKTSP
jgi:hypothetical protein